MIESKLNLIGNADRKRWQIEIKKESGNLSSALTSADHEQRVVDRQAKQGTVMTVITGPLPKKGRIT